MVRTTGRLTRAHSSTVTLSPRASVGPMDETFIAELVVAGPSPDHERALAEQAIGWYGHRRVRCLDLEVRDAPAPEQSGLFVLRGRFFAVGTSPQGSLQRAAQWLGLVPGPGTRSSGARR